MKRTIIALVSIFLFLLPLVGSGARSGRMGRTRQSSGTGMWV